MRIGTITFHCAYNFGSALQAYALKEYLTNLGHDVHIIDYRSDDFRQYRIFRRYGFKSTIADLFFLSRNLRRRAGFQLFWRKHFNLTNRTYEGSDAEHLLSEDLEDYNALICGSDQIWNLDCTLGAVPPFFLSFASDRTKKIAYAPSLSHVKFEEKNFTPEDKKRIARWLERFDAISVREISTADQFQQLTDKMIVETLDPTLLLNLEDYRHIQSPSLPKKLKAGEYVFTYTLWPNDDMVNYVDRLAEEHNLTVVYYSRNPIHYKSRSTNVYGIGPADFLALIDKANCVISNSFHATVFSILYCKPFLTFGTEKSSSRMKTLLIKLGLSEKHLLPMNFNEIIKTEPFIPNLDVNLLNELRASSEQFLKAALTE